MKPPFKLNPINSLLPFDPARGLAELSAPETFVQHVIVSTSREDYAATLKIVDRYVDLCKQYGLQMVKDTGVIAASSMQLGLDIIMCHARTPLELGRLLLTSDEDFTHDVAGIARNIDRMTGHLRDGFTPRNLKSPAA